MGAAVLVKILFLSLCLSEIFLGTSAGISRTSVELFREFFTAAQEFKTAVVAAGGIEKIKQDLEFKGISPKIIDVVFGAGKALEDLPNPDIAPRISMADVTGFFKSTYDQGKKAWNGVKDICKTIVSKDDTVKT